MIKLTKFNKKEFYLNPYLIQDIETNPDVTIRLTTGEKILILDKIESVIDKIILFYRTINNLELKTTKLINENNNKLGGNQWI